MESRALHLGGSFELQVFERLLHLFGQSKVFECFGLFWHCWLGVFLDFSVSGATSGGKAPNKTSGFCCDSAPDGRYPSLDSCVQKPVL